MPVSSVTSSTEFFDLWAINPLFNACMHCMLASKCLHLNAMLASKIEQSISKHSISIQLIKRT